MVLSSSTHWKKKKKMAGVHGSLFVYTFFSIRFTGNSFQCCECTLRICCVALLNELYLPTVASSLVFWLTPVTGERPYTFRVCLRLTPPL